MKNYSKYATITVFILVIGGFFVLNLVTSPPEILESERRPPAAFPEITEERFADASAMNDFDQWAQDSFAFREGFRTLRAGAVFYVFQETDKDGLYCGHSGAGKFEKIDKEAWLQAIEKINRVHIGLSDGTFADGGLSVYAAVIPDKSVYAGGYLPGYDPETKNQMLGDELSAGIRSIDLTAALSAQDFYKTDLHWAQTRTGRMMVQLGKAMGFTPPAMETVQNAGAFTGAYAGQLALPMQPDTLSYGTNASIEGASVFYLDPKTAVMTPGKIYHPEALTDGGDPYDFFLNGPQPLIVLETSAKTTGRTLYLFRDSFGSSLAPLFLGAYDKVVLIDLRYIDSRVLKNYIVFEPGADALFLYSSQIMNNPSSLLVNG